VGSRWLPGPLSGCSQHGFSIRLGLIQKSHTKARLYQGHLIDVDENAHKMLRNYGAESQPGQRATFRVSLPQTKEMGMNPIEIVLIEDNPRDVELTLRAFRKSNLLNRVHVLEDGDRGLQFLLHQEQKPRVILLDLKMPKLSGLEVLRELKRNEKTRSIPVVVVTSSREDPDIAAAYALGANSYVVKPVEFENFQRVMAELGQYWLLVNQSPKVNNQSTAPVVPE
jgi:two-component system, response regulator